MWTITKAVITPLCKGKTDNLNYIICTIDSEKTHLGMQKVFEQQPQYKPLLKILGKTDKNNRSLGLDIEAHTMSSQDLTNLTNNY